MFLLHHVISKDFPVESSSSDLHVHRQIFFDFTLFKIFLQVPHPSPLYGGDFRSPLCVNKQAISDSRRMHTDFVTDSVTYRNFLSVKILLFGCINVILDYLQFSSPLFVDDGFQWLHPKNLLDCRLNI